MGKKKITSDWPGPRLSGGIDWDEFDSELDSIIESSAEATDQLLASKISSITRMTDDEVEELFPDPADVKKLSELIKIVKSQNDTNTKIVEILSDAERLSPIILKLLEKFV